MNPHYVIILCDKNDRLILLDPPRAPINLDDEDLGDIAELTGLTVLYCVRDVGADLDWRVDVATHNISESSFTNGVHEFGIQLVNNGGSPIAITSAAASCSCIKVDFSPFVLNPGSKHSVSASIDESKWGASTQMVSFSDSLGRQERVTVQGASFQVADGSSQLVQKMMDRVVYIRVPQRASIGSVDISFHVPTPSRLAGDVVLQSDAFSDSVDVVSLTVNGNGTAIEGVFRLTAQQVLDVSRGQPVSFSSAVSVGGATSGM